MNKFNKISLALLATTFATGAIATETETQKEVQDMSDPLAVFTQAGVGVTNKGLNLKIGKTYDTGSDVKMGMNLIEVKGFGGEALGWDGSSAKDNSIDSFRFRNFTVDTTNGRGAQIDMNYDVEAEALDASYSFIQALPKFGFVQLYPLAGAGVRVANDADVGYTAQGTYALVGTYSKITITDKIWLNYNPMYLSTLSGSDSFKETGFGEDSIFLHEFAASYQISPIMNVRYFANWDEHNSFGEGDHRVEFNYQF
ncbi:hypothetical protein [Vibrio crassostreae]|uniref:hypothetical protein n=1 Tax=Vibrio crassostreae TaxID=246167 RepID=UPI001B30B93D|nr:hypothetical protein [Vibrio crassostreae]